jgi:hypothetical protein
MKQDPAGRQAEPWTQRQQRDLSFDPFVAFAR